MKNKSSNTFKFKGVKAKTVWGIKDIVSFCSHQVVSHQFIEMVDYYITAFFFDKGEGISTDIQHQDILYIVKNGKAEIKVEKTCNDLIAGACIMVPGGFPHSIIATEPLWIMQIAVGEIPKKVKRNGGYEMNKTDYIKNIEKASVHSLKGIVEYQEDKVTSLTLIQRSTFSTTIMAMDKGTGVGPHICEGDAMVVAIDGIGDVMIGDEHYQVEEGQSIVMPSGIPHAVRGEKSQFKMLLIVSNSEM